ncbi:MAG: exonuclease domain-containing protein [Rhodospirillaceae bacterium]
MWTRLFGTDLTRWILAARCPPGPLKSYYRVDTPTADTPYTRAEFLAVDIETTGLARDDEIVSIGFVPVIEGRVRLAAAERLLVRPGRPVGDAAAKVHGLLDDRLAAAGPLDAALARLLAALAGRIPIAHHAAVERAFLSRACRAAYGHPLVTPWVDTLALAKRNGTRGNAVLASGELRLSSCRRRRGLPRHRSHDALADALACAELFLAEAAACSGKAPAPLRDLL